MSAPSPARPSDDDHYELDTEAGDTNVYEEAYCHVPSRDGRSPQRSPAADSEQVGLVDKKKKTKPKPDTEDPGLVYSQVDKSKKTKPRPDSEDPGLVYSQVDKKRKTNPKPGQSTQTDKDADVLLSENEIYSQ